MLEKRRFHGSRGQTLGQGPSIVPGDRRQNGCAFAANPPDTRGTAPRGSWGTRPEVMPLDIPRSEEPSEAFIERPTTKAVLGRSAFPVPSHRRRDDGLLRYVGIEQVPEQLGREQPVMKEQFQYLQVAFRECHRRNVVGIFFRTRPCRGRVFPVKARASGSPPERLGKLSRPTPDGLVAVPEDGIRRGQDPRVEKQAWFSNRSPGCPGPLFGSTAWSKSALTTREPDKAGNQGNHLESGGKRRPNTPKLRRLSPVRSSGGNTPYELWPERLGERLTADPNRPKQGYECRSAVRPTRARPHSFLAGAAGRIQWMLTGRAGSGKRLLSDQEVRRLWHQ